MLITPPRKRSLLVLVSVGAGLVLFALCFAFPVHAVIPFGLAALGMIFHPAVPVFATLLASALLAALFGPGAAAQLLMFAPSGLMLPFLVKKKASSLYAVFIAASVAILAMWCGMVYFSQAINAAFAEQKALIVEQYAQLPQLADDEPFGMFLSAEGISALRSTHLLLLETARIMLPASVFTYSMVAALLIYLLCRKIAQKRGIAIAPFAPFANWRLPYGFGFGAAILFMASFLAEINYGQEQAPLIFLLRSVVVVPFTVQGMCVLEFYMSKKKVHAAARVAANVALALFLSLALTYCGVFEHAFAFRRRADLRIK